MKKCEIIIENNIRLAEEPFYSIQGEGPFAGTPAYFIRFSKCSNICPFCDSKYSWKKGKIKLSLDHLTPPCNCKHIVLTGGEPLLYVEDPNVVSFIREYCKDHIIAFETTGITNVEEDFHGELYGTCFDKLTEMDIGLSSSDNIKYIVSPKLDSGCYKEKVSMDDVFDYYLIPDLIFDLHHRLKGQLFYKFIYQEKYKKELETYIKTELSKWFLPYVYIMPMTPIPYQKELYIYNCVETVEFCKKLGVNYSPRLQIDIWGLRKGV